MIEVPLRAETRKVTVKYLCNFSDHHHRSYKSAARCIAMQKSRGDSKSLTPEFLVCKACCTNFAGFIVRYSSPAKWALRAKKMQEPA